MVGIPGAEKCYAYDCGLTNLTISETIAFKESEIIPEGAIDFNFLLPHLTECIFTDQHIVYSYSEAQGGTDMLHKDTSLLITVDVNEEFFFFRNQISTQYFKYNRNTTTDSGWHTIEGHRLTYGGNMDTYCTFDNQNDNKCLINGVEFKMGEMCAHKIYIMENYLVLSCSK